MPVCEIHVLGTSSATPIDNRFPSAQYVALQGWHCLLDCGEGTQMQMLKYGVKKSKIQSIFISHLHPDHFLGLPGLLSSLNLMGRKETLCIVGPVGLEAMMENFLLLSSLKLSYSMVYRELKEGAVGEFELVSEHKQVRVYATQVRHRLPCWAFILEEIVPPYNLILERVQADKVPDVALKYFKMGQDHEAAGKVWKHTDYVTTGDEPFRYAYVTDTLMLPKLAEMLAVRFPNSVLYHESTFLHELEGRALETMHSTAKQAGQFARIAKAQQLILGHYSSRYMQLEPLRLEASAEFTNTALAYEGLVMEY